MTSVLGAIVEGDVLLKIVVSAFVGGVGISSVFGLVIHGSARFDDNRRAGRTGVAAVYGVVTALALAAFVAAVVIALTIVFSK